MTAVTQRQNDELASIGSVSYSLGTLKSIDDLDFLREEPGMLERYKDAGFERYAESDLSMRELACAAARQTLETCGVAPAEIDTCLYVAESLGRDEPVSFLEVNRLLVTLGLERAVPIHVSIAACANILAALRVAVALLQAGDARHVLVISVDKASRRDGGRWGGGPRSFSHMSVKSDLALSCLVSKPGLGDYGILYVRQHNDARLVDLVVQNAASYSVCRFNQVRQAAKRAREALGLRPDDFARVLTNKHSRDVTATLVELCGFRQEAGWYASVVHAGAGDVLINLKDLEAERRLESGDLLFLMAESATSISVLCLQRR